MCSDKGLVVHGIPNTALFNVSSGFRIRLFFKPSMQVLFWLHNITWTVLQSIKYPFLQRLREGYPFNSLMGKLCSGYGIHSSRLNVKDNALNLHFFIHLVVYLFIITYCFIKIKVFLRKISPKGSGTPFNGKFR